MAFHSFEDLEVWKRACRLAVDVCAGTHSWKNFGLKDQLQRSAISIPSNIAEGSERDSDGDFKRFLRISKGSCGELRTQLYIAKRVAEKLNSTDTELPESCIAETREISAMLQGLIKSINARQQDSKN